MAIQIKSSDQTMMSDINVTPLVDVMLVLLIVFIVTTPLMLQDVPVRLPHTSANLPSSRVSSVRLSVDGSGNIHLDAQAVGPEQLQAKLRALRERNPELNVRLMADERVSYGRVAKVMGVVQQAGIAKLSVVTVRG